jgi:hypothetical protein
MGSSAVSLSRPTKLETSSGRLFSVRHYGWRVTSDTLAVIDRHILVDTVARRLRRTSTKSGWHAFSPTLASVEPPTFTLVVGAGFSAGVIPMTKELMCETIGDYYEPDQDQTSMQRPVNVLRAASRSFWMEYNRVCAAEGRDVVELNDRGADRGLPKECSGAYQSLFAYDGANALFQPDPPASTSLLEKLQAKRDRSPLPPSNMGEEFVKGFLSYVLAPGVEHGDGFTGRVELNEAHRSFATILEAQQIGWGGRLPFCRTIFTTNFDTMLQVMLQEVRIVPVVTDRPEYGIVGSTFNDANGAIHLVYTHGTVLRHNPASSVAELAGLATPNTEALRQQLDNRDVLVIGYGGWNDGLTAAMRGGTSSHVYWCGISDEPPANVVELAAVRSGPTTYVVLGEGGAGGLMAELRDCLVTNWSN